MDRDHARRQARLRVHERLEQRLGDRHPDQPGRRIADRRRHAPRRDRDHPRRQARLRHQHRLGRRLGDRHPDQPGRPGADRGRHAPDRHRHHPRPGPGRFLRRPGPRPGVPVALDASASSDPDGTIAGYAGTSATGRARPPAAQGRTHAYAKPGNYRVDADPVTDQEGCSTTFVFTGQTAYCNGGPRASQTQTVKVAYPGVRVRCPKRAGPGGCRFKLQAVTKRRKGKPESAVCQDQGEGREGRDHLAEAEASLWGEAGDSPQDPGRRRRSGSVARPGRLRSAQGRPVADHGLSLTTNAFGYSGSRRLGRLRHPAAGRKVLAGAAGDVARRRCGRRRSRRPGPALPPEKGRVEQLGPGPIELAEEAVVVEIGMFREMAGADLSLKGAGGSREALRVGQAGEEDVAGAIESDAPPVASEPRRVEERRLWPSGLSTVTKASSNPCRWVW